jgi:hypothetical protein
LKPTLRRDKHEFDKFRKRHRTIRSNWKTLKLPQDDKTDKINETRAEIKRLQKANLELDASADALDILYLEVKTDLKNRAKM